MTIKAGDTVKKTIFAAIGMIALFSLTVFAFSGIMEKQWQTPRQDDVNLTVQSPVEMVEQEYREYNYKIDEELTFEENKYDTVSFAEAVSIGGTVLEKVYPFIDFGQITFSVNKVSYEKVIIQYSYNSDDLRWTVYCYINSRTGYVENYGYSRNTKDAEDVIIKNYLEEYKNDTESLFVKESASQMEQMGYTDIKHYDTKITENNIYNIYLTGKMNGVEEKVLYKYWYYKWSNRYYVEHHFTLYPLGING